MALSLFTATDPFTEVRGIQNQLDTLFNNFFTTHSPSSALSNNQVLSGLWRPNVDVKETPDALLIHAELPGLKKEGILHT